jgi:hypothetical protein
MDEFEYESEHKAGAEINFDRRASDVLKAASDANC